MSAGRSIAFFASSLASAYRNGARDIPDPPWAKVVVYPGKGEEGVLQAVESANGADGVGVFDELLESAVLNLKRSTNRVVFWDVDAPRDHIPAGTRQSGHPQ